MLSQSALDHMAEHFFGYGRWDAPYWFVGPEAECRMRNTLILLLFLFPDDKAVCYS
jgi:hypothetical protein